MAEEKKRVRHSNEERIAEIDKKIVYYKDLISKMEQKKEAILNPKPRKGRIGVSSVVKLAKEKGMSVDEMMKKLGLDDEEQTE